MKKLTQKDREAIRNFFSLFPKAILVRTSRSEEGGFHAEILGFPGCFTQADTFTELVAMINDALYTYLEVPERLLPYMPEYMVPISVAQKFGIFPTTNKIDDIRLQNIKRETVKS